MPFKVFQYRIPADPDLPELNEFLAANPIAQVTRRIAETEEGIFVVILVETTRKKGPAAAAAGEEVGRKPPLIDYREVLSPADFGIYSQLRDLRKKLAEEHGVKPIYNVFRNEELATMVTRKVRTLAELKQIDGVGDGKVKEYGAAVIDLLQRALPATGREAGRKNWRGLTMS